MRNRKPASKHVLPRKAKAIKKVTKVVAKSPAAKKRTRRPTLRGARLRAAAPRPTSLAVGDVLVLSRDDFRPVGPRPPAAPGTGGGEWDALEGVVCSIRDIRTGKLAAKTTKPLEQYVIEVLQHRTFRGEFSSARNAGGPRGPAMIALNPAWQRVRTLLQQMAARKELVSLSSGTLAAQLFDPLLDGWRVTKIKVTPP